eukprot:2883653-Amphidinium_carterae.1
MAMAFGCGGRVRRFRRIFPFCQLGEWQVLGTFTREVDGKKKEYSLCTCEIAEGYGRVSLNKYCST